MFNNTIPNIILLADHTDVLTMNKPLGVHKIASELRKAGFEVLVLNHLHVFSVDEIKRVLAHTVSEQTLFVGFSTMFYRTVEDPITIVNSQHPHEEGGTRFHDKQPGAMIPHGIKYNKEIRELIKAINPKCALVIGGPDAIDVSYISDYDYTVIGYAEISVINLARHLAFGDELLKSRKSVHRSIIVDDRLASDYNFAETPMYYDERDIILPGETMPIEIGRGCIFRCAFCSYPLNGKKKNDYVKLEELLRLEFINNYEKFGVTRYMFNDDTLNDSRDKIEMIHRVSKSLPFKLEYWAYIRLDLLAAHPQTMELLFDSGLRACHFGIETLNAETASIIGKGGSRQTLIDTLAYIKDRWGNQVSLNGSFIFGLPHEPIESMRRTGEQLLSGEVRLDSWSIYPFFLRVHNGSTWTSQIDDQYEKYGYRTGNFTDIPPPALGTGIPWKNEFTNHHECNTLVNEIMSNGLINRTVSGQDSIYIAGLGLDMDYSINQLISEFDWHSVDLQKQKRAVEYKKELCKKINIDYDVLTQRKISNEQTH